MRQTAVRSVGREQAVPVTKIDSPNRRLEAVVTVANRSGDLITSADPGSGRSFQRHLQAGHGRRAEELAAKRPQLLGDRHAEYKPTSVGERVRSGINAR